MVNDDIILNDKEKEDAINKLKSRKFEDFEVHKHYYNSFNGRPRHGVTLETAKEIFYQFKKIGVVTKRPAIKGYKYCFIYNLRVPSS